MAMYSKWTNESKSRGQRSGEAKENCTKSRTSYIETVMCCNVVMPIPVVFLPRHTFRFQVLFMNFRLFGSLALSVLVRFIAHVQHAQMANAFTVDCVW